jgi:DNA-binding transcriptional ArsR family regulator
MVQYIEVRTYHDQSRLFKALMHPVRLAILEELRGGEQCVCHLEAALGYRQAYISQHLMILREAGLVQDVRDGWNIFYRVVQPLVYQVIDSSAGLLTPESSTTRRPRQAVKQKAPCPCPKCNPGVEKSNSKAC